MFTKAHSAKLFLPITNAVPIMLTILAALLLVSCHGAGRGPRTDISDLVAAAGASLNSSTLLIVRQSDGAEWYSNEGRLDRRLVPASTSKIPHTLIALETGAAGPDTVFSWDGVQRGIAEWNQDHTLTSAYRTSAVWVYQELTSQLGYTTMAEWIELCDFGNQNIGDPDDLERYWLDGPLVISTREQIRFLVTVAQAELPFSKQTYDQARQIMTEDQGEDWTLYAKTGWALRGDLVDIGWYVGWVDKKTNDGNVETYYFAFNLDMPAPKEDGVKRKAVVHKVLKDIGIIS
ncbi:MAG: penicillin-binding transpeptidase domain-containing protein [Pseudomonadota bacterium]